MRGIFNRMYVSIYELPCEEKCTRDGGKKSEVSDEGLYGQGFEVIKRCVGSSGDFIRIRTDYGYEGYVRSGDVIICEDTLIYRDNSVCEDWLENKKHKFMQVKKSVADILSAPFVSAVRLMSVTRGAVLMCCGETSVSHPDCDYVCIRLYDGRAGYIKKSYLEPYAAPLDEKEIGRLDEDSFREKLVQTAKSYLGTQYRWGGKTPLGIDCSGLTSMAYMLNGVYIYRDARLVPGFAVKEIPYESMKKGDLIYFPGHIAMYTGDGEYIHSTAREGSDGVVINSLDKGSVRYREDLAQSICAVGSIFSACRQS